MAARYRTLSDSQVQQFIARGFVKIEGAFSREQAQAWSADVWTRLGYDPQDRATWAQPRIHMPRFDTVEVKEFAPKAWDAICDLCGGAERIQQPCLWADGFIVNLGTDDDPARWIPPSAAAPGWHKDGDWFLHFLDSPEQGLLTLVCWSEIAPRGGATYIATDSVGVVARFLAQRPDGVRPEEFDFPALIRQCHAFEEATGAPGDVYLLHPYLLHTASANALRRPRLITNPCVSLREPLRFDRPDGDYSPVERAVLHGLGEERLAFAPTAPRARIVPERERIQARMKEEEQARLAARAR